MIIQKQLRGQTKNAAFEAVFVSCDSVICKCQHKYVSLTLSGASPYMFCG